MTKPVLVCLAVAAFAAVASGQGGGAPADRATQELLTEVRALRADVNRAAGSSIRAQLLVARLQLQEQRILTVSRQIDDVQQELAGLAQARAGLEMVVKQVDEAATSPDPSERQAAEAQSEAADMIKQQLSQHHGREQQLRQQESSLTALLAEEQARWTEFSSRLDELERVLTPSRQR